RVQIVWRLSFFFFKQKTAYEISRDWSSDVCSSDLHRQRIALVGLALREQLVDLRRLEHDRQQAVLEAVVVEDVGEAGGDDRAERSEERRVGKEGGGRGARGEEEEDGGGVVAERRAR